MYALLNLSLRYAYTIHYNGVVVKYEYAPYSGVNMLLCQTIQKSQLFEPKKGVFRFILGLYCDEKTPNLSQKSRVLTSILRAKRFKIAWFMRHALNTF